MGLAGVVDGLVVGLAVGKLDGLMVGAADLVGFAVVDIVGATGLGLGLGSGPSLELEELSSSPQSPPFLLLSTFNSLSTALISRVRSCSSRGDVTSAGNLTTSCFASCRVSEVIPSHVDAISSTEINTSTRNVK